MTKYGSTLAIGGVDTAKNGLFPDERIFTITTTENGPSKVRPVANTFFGVTEVDGHGHAVHEHADHHADHEHADHEHADPGSRFLPSSFPATSIFFFFDVQESA